MSRGNYSQGKRQRDNEKARKKKEKAEKRRMRRESGPGEVEYATAESMTADLPSIEEAMRKIERRDSAERSAPAIPCRLFVGGLSWDTTTDSLKAAFAAHGPVSEAIIVTDRDTGRSRGFGFVTMANRKDASKAIDKMDRSELDGRSIVVNIATERSR